MPYSDQMQIEDPIHGTVEIEDRVLKDLMETSPVQRLKHVNQAGPQKYYMEKPVTRYDHSVGVMLLLREFNAALEEQIAGLLHDVPHTAFSHLADYVFDTEDHEYHERFLEDVVRDSEIPEILDQHGFELDHILDESNFHLLERDLPDLCADRIDYFLRDWQQIGGGEVGNLLSDLSVEEDRFVLTDREKGEDYSLKYIEADERWWANPEELAIWELFSRAIQRALETGILEEEHLFGTDEEVYQALDSSEDERIEELLGALESGLEVEVDPDFVAETKFRYVDPLVVDGREKVRVTDYSERLQERIEEHRSYLENGVPISLRSPEI
ncbi:MAG: HD domain-containing protein [Candidatus Nanohaloarchaea archaeon]|nr:HD domain-containing protein [Candidatus Nanohaloarchaea archaeon]